MKINNFSIFKKTSLFLLFCLFNNNMVRANDLLTYSKFRASEAILDVELVLKCASSLNLDQLVNQSEIIDQNELYIYVETKLENCQFKTLKTKYYFTYDFTSIWDFTE